MEKNQKFILAGWLIDGSGGDIQKNMLLCMQNGYIHSIHKAEADILTTGGHAPLSPLYQTGGHAPLCPPYKSDILDLSDYTILPGLIDSHLHLFMSGTDDQAIRQHQLNAEFHEIKDVITYHLEQLAMHGIIAVRDGGDKNAFALRYKMEYFDSEETPVIIRVAGKAWRKSGRYGKLIARTPSNQETLSEAFDRVYTSEEEKGIDHIKIVNSGLNSLKQFGKETSPQFNFEEMRAAVDTADKFGYKVMVHANGKIPVRISVEAGCHSIEHGFFMGKENLKIMADKQITWVPTAITMKGYSENLDPGSIEADISLRNLEDQLEQIAYAKEIGVPVALGTDAGSLGVHHGSGVIEEMKLFMKAGYSIQEAVRCSAYNGANLLDIKKSGLLAPGMFAEFIAVKGEPAGLPGSLKNVLRFRF